MNLDEQRALGHSPRVPVYEEGWEAPCPCGPVPGRGWSGLSWRFLMDRKARGVSTGDLAVLVRWRGRGLTACPWLHPLSSPRASAGFNSIGDTQLKPSGIPDFRPRHSGRPGHSRVREPRDGRPEPRVSEVDLGSRSSAPYPFSLSPYRSFCGIDCRWNKWCIQVGSVTVIEY